MLLPKVKKFSNSFWLAGYIENNFFFGFARGFPGDTSGKESTYNAGDTGDVGSIPGSRRSPGGGHGNLLQYSCLENPMDRGAWWATVHGDTKSQTRLKQLIMHEQYILQYQYNLDAHTRAC